MHLPDIGLSVVYILVMCATFSAIVSVAVTFISSRGAFASVSTIVGTFVGFLAMAYIPAEAVPGGVVRVLNWLPFAKAAMLVRVPFTARSLSALSKGQAQAEAAFRENYGITVAVAGHQLSSLAVAGILLAIAIVFSVIGSWRLSRGVA